MDKDAKNARAMLNKPIGAVSKIRFIGDQNTIIKLSKTEIIEAQIRYLFTNKERPNTLFLKDLKLNAFAIAKNIMVNNVVVCATVSDCPKTLST